MKNVCKHCWSDAQQVQCVRCTRTMCADCIQDGQVCGSCFDATLAAITALRVKVERTLTVGYAQRMVQ